MQIRNQPVADNYFVSLYKKNVLMKVRNLLKYNKLVKILNQSANF